MNKIKRMTCYTEVAYVLGILTLALGTAFMAKADFGVSMVVAPAYLLYLKLSETYTFVTFGMAEYLLQGVLLLVMMLILKRFRKWYLFSFITAVFYGIMLDIFTLVVQYIAMPTFSLRIVYYTVGFLLCAIGVAFIFKTYIAPEVYELFVKEVSRTKSIQIHKFKLAYDLISCVVAVVMSFAFFGWWSFEGIKWGTVVVAIINGGTIGLMSRGYEKVFEFKDRFELKSYFSDAIEVEKSKPSLNN